MNNSIIRTLVRDDIEVMRFAIRNGGGRSFKPSCKSIVDHIVRVDRTLVSDGVENVKQ